MKAVKRSFLTAVFLLLAAAAQMQLAVSKVFGANIVPDNSAGHGPGMDIAPNGTPVINLTAPSPAGVSLNHFSSYNVDESNLILNNSVQYGQSVLGGYICGNPDYQQNGRTADLVVNEVTGSLPSTLAGTTEMFGKSADLVLLNPNGMYVSGAGFINMPSASLITGRGIYEGGSFKGADVSGGSIEIGSGGMNAYGTDRLDLVTRSITVGGAVKAENLHMQTGTGSYDYGSRKLKQEDRNAGPAPQFAVDCSVLGNVSAGRIYLVGNEAGLGVRSDSALTADAGDLVITAQGNIELADTAAAGNLSVTAAGSFTGRGTSESMGRVEVSADSIDNEGFVSGLGGVSLTGKTVTNGPDASVESGGFMNITADQVNNLGLLLSSGDMSITAAILRNQQGAVCSFDDLLFEGMEDMDLYNDEGFISADGSVTMNLGRGKLYNNGLDRDAVYTLIKQFKSDYQSESTVVLEEYTADYEKTSVPSVISAGTDLTVEASVLENNGSLILAGQDMNLNADTVKNLTFTEDLFLPEWRHWGKKEWVSEKIGPFTYDHHNRYSDWWDSGTLTFISSDQASVLAGGNLSVKDGASEENTGLWNGFAELPGIHTVYSDRIQNIKDNGYADSSDYIHYLNGMPVFQQASRDSQYLVETRSQFVDQSDFFGSEYFLSRAGIEVPDGTKFAGDPFYEQQLVSLMVEQALKRKYISKEVSSDREQMLILMDNAENVMENLHLSIGTELTPEQISSLQQPVVWYVYEVIDGETVLIPRIYVPSSMLEGFDSGQGAVLAGGSVDIDIDGSVHNSGFITAEEDINIQSSAFYNESAGGSSGILSSGEDLTADVQGVFSNLSGTVHSGDDIIINSGSLYSGSYIEQENSSGQIFSYTGSTAEISAGGNADVSADGDIEIHGILHGDGDVWMEAAGSVNITNQEVFSQTGSSGGGTSWSLTQTEILPVEVNTAGSFGLNAGGGILIQGSTVNTGGSFYGKAGKTFSIADAYESRLYERIHHGDSTWSSFDSYTREWDKVSVGSSIQAGEGVELISGEDLIIQGSTISAGGSISRQAEGSITENAAVNEHEYVHTETKSGFGHGGVWGKSQDADSVQDFVSAGSSSSSEGNNSYDAGADVTLTGSCVSAGNCISMEAGGDISLLSSYDYHSEEHLHSSASFVDGLNLADITADTAGNMSVSSHGTEAEAGGFISHSSGDTLLSGSTVSAYSVDINTDGAFTAETAENFYMEHSSHENINITAGDCIRDFDKIAGDFFNYNNTPEILETLFSGESLSVTLATGEYLKQENSTSETSQTSSGIYGQNVSISSKGDLTVTGSYVSAKDDLSLSSEKNVVINCAVETADSSESTAQGAVVVSAGVSNSGGSAAQAIKEAAEATEKLDQARKDYDAYLHEKEKAEEAYKKGLITKETYDRTMEAEKYYLANIVLCTENQAAAALAAVSAAGNAAASLGTAGFKADVNMDISASVNTSSSHSENTVGSVIAGEGNVVIKAGESADITGSTVTSYSFGEPEDGEEPVSAGNILIEAGEIRLGAGEGSSSGSSSSHSLNASFGIGTAGLSFSSASGNVSQNENDASFHVNSVITGGNITLNSEGNITGSGVNVDAEGALSVSAGGNLLLESLQDTSSSSSASFGGGVNTSGGNASLSVSSSDRSWVTDQTSFTGNSVDINVAGKTSIRGAVIDSDDEKLDLTTGSLEYSSIQDSEGSFSFGLSAECSTGEGESDSSGTVSGDYGVNWSSQNNIATVGAGTITVLDGGSTEGLNRDTSVSQYEGPELGFSGAFEINEEILHPLDTLSTAFSQGVALYNRIEAGLPAFYEDLINVLSEPGNTWDSIVSGLGREASGKIDSMKEKINGIFQSLGLDFSFAVSEAEESVPEEEGNAAEGIQKKIDDFVAALKEKYPDIDIEGLASKIQNYYQMSLGSTRPGKSACTFTSYYMIAQILGGNPDISLAEAFDMAVNTLSWDGKNSAVRGKDAYVRDPSKILELLGVSGGPEAYIDTGAYDPVSKKFGAPTDSAVNDMIKVLNEGAVIHARVGEGPGKERGHSVVFDGYTVINNQLYFTVKDPAGVNSSYTYYDPRENRLCKPDPKKPDEMVLNKTKTLMKYNIIRKNKSKEKKNEKNRSRAYDSGRSRRFWC